MNSRGIRRVYGIIEHIPQAGFDKLAGCARILLGEAGVVFVALEILMLPLQLIDRDRYVDPVAINVHRVNAPVLDGSLLAERGHHIVGKAAIVGGDKQLRARRNELVQHSREQATVILVEQFLWIIKDEELQATPAL